MLSPAHVRGLKRSIHCVYCILQSSRRIRVSISQSGAVYVLLDERLSGIRYPASLRHGETETQVRRQRPDCFW